MNKTFRVLGVTVITIAILALMGAIVYVRIVQRTSEPIAAPAHEESLRHIGESDDHGTQVFSMSLATTLETDVYRFTGNQIEVHLSCRREGEEKGSSEYLAVELHRIDAGLIDTLAETQTLKRWGSSSAVFTDVPQGEYYLRFVKDADGQIVVCDAVRVQGFVVNSKKPSWLPVFALCVP